MVPRSLRIVTAAAAIVSLLDLQMVPSVSTAAAILGFFSNCVNDVDDCILQNLQIGQYPHCRDCSIFAKCHGRSSSLIQCPPGLLYDVTLGVCNYIGQAVCGTTTTRTSSTSTSSTTSLASSSSLTNETPPTSLLGSTIPTGPSNPASPTAPTSLASPMSPTSPTSLMSPTIPTSPMSPTSPTSLMSPTTPTSPISPTSPTSPNSPTSLASPTSPTSPASLIGPTTLANPTGQANPISVQLFLNVNTFPVITYDCVSSFIQCFEEGRIIGRYPLCDDCSTYVECDGHGAATGVCQAGTKYDHFRGACSPVDRASCFTRQT